MRNWTVRAFVLADPNVLPQAQRVLKALDSDARGEDSFLRCTLDGYFVCSFPVTELYADFVFVLLQNPAWLHELCTQQYAERFPELEPPDEEACLEFTHNVHVLLRPLDTSTQDVLAEFSTELFEPDAVL